MFAPSAKYEESPSTTLKLKDILHSFNAKSVLDFIVCVPETSGGGVHRKRALKLRQLLLDKESANIISGVRMLESYEATSAIYSTGIKSLDELLGGGISSGHITELTGQTSTGKSQICMQISACIAAKFERNVLYVDSTGCFCAHRILEFMKALGHRDEESDAALSRISCVLCPDMHTLLSVLSSAAMKKITMLIIDSITTIAISELNLPNKVEGLGLLNLLANTLKSFVADRKRAVVVTNGVVHIGTPALGRAWLHVPCTRIELARTELGNAREYTANLKKSNKMVSRSVRFLLQ